MRMRCVTMCDCVGLTHDPNGRGLHPERGGYICLNVAESRMRDRPRIPLKVRRFV